MKPREIDNKLITLQPVDSYLPSPVVLWVATRGVTSMVNYKSSYDHVKCRWDEGRKRVAEGQSPGAQIIDNDTD